MNTTEHLDEKLMDWLCAVRHGGIMKFILERNAEEMTTPYKDLE